MPWKFKDWHLALILKISEQYRDGFRNIVPKTKGLRMNRKKEIIQP